MKNIIKTISFIFILLSGISLLEKIFKPLVSYPSYAANCSYKIKSIPKEKQNVLFLGSSHVYSSCNPFKLYERRKIISYTLATDAQRLSGSYYLLKEFFRKSKTELVVLDVSSFFVHEEKDENYLETGFYHIIDELPFGIDKLRYAKLYNSYNFKKLGNLITMLSPFYHYHDRWNNLNEFDFFKYTDRLTYFLRGYDGMTWTQAGIYDNEWLNLQNAQQRERININEICWKDGIKYENKTVDDVFTPSIPEANILMLKRIEDLCRQNNAKLLLIKVPVIIGPAEYESAWTIEKSELVKQCAVNCKIPFVDLQYDVDLNINSRIDYFDAGKHLNDLGAQKVSNFLADYIANNYSVSNLITSKEIENQIELYQKHEYLTHLAFSESLQEYFYYLNNNKNLAVLMTFYDDGLYGITEEEKGCLQDYGLQTDFSDAQFSDAFIAVVDKGNVVYEALSNNKLEYDYTLLDGKKVELLSSGFLTYRGSKINIEKKDYALSQSGLHIVVYDYETHSVIDRFGMDLRTKENRVFRAPIYEIVSTLINYDYELMKIGGKKRARMFFDNEK